jgi:hypothetical protein
MGDLSAQRVKRCDQQISVNAVWLSAMLALAALVLFVIRLPGSMQFDSFAFFDTGANLTIQNLLNRGYRPTVDFAYLYGLLPLAFGHFWFSALGFTPLACIVAVPVADILIVWGMVRFATALRLNIAGVLLFIAATPYTIPSSYLNLSNLLEAVFLCHALAEQARGNRRAALALVTGCAFVKPSMAYVYGFVLLVLMIAGAFRHRTHLLRRIGSDIYPAVLTGVTMSVLLATMFGVSPLLNSLFPTAGIKIYKAEHFGFFHEGGRGFWAPPDVHWTYYVSSLAGPWIAGSLFLIVAGLFAVVRLLTTREDDERATLIWEMVLVCGALHLAFILLFFGNQWSEVYYFYVLVFGLAAIARLGTGSQLVVAALAVAIPAVVVNKWIIHRLTPAATPVMAGAEAPGSAGAPAAPSSGFTYQLWFTSSPNWETGGLWSSSSERAEWSNVLSLIRGKRAALIVWYGCADVLFPDFMPPVTALLAPGVDNPSDLQRKIAQLDTATIVVMPRWQSSLLDTSPAIGTVVRRNFVKLREGNQFVIYRRRGGS